MVEVSNYYGPEALKIKIKKDFYVFRYFFFFISTITNLQENKYVFLYIKYQNQR